MKKEEEEDSIEEIGQILEEEMDIRSVRPVAAAEVEEARMQFSREYFQNIVRQVAPTRGVTTPSQAVVEQPNLQVPVGEEYLYLAQ